MDASVNRIKSSKDERAYLIGLRIDRDNLEAVEYSLSELVMLVETAGAITVDKRIISREKIDPAFIIGKGYIKILKEYIEENRIRLIVFDLNTIRPAQIRNLEETLKCRVIGRNEIILDIFACRARSREAKIQVELAQYKYILPRLKGLGGVLSRLGGGIGTRGPGEKMLETDRRHILRRIDSLSKKLGKIKRHRERTRKSRDQAFTGAVVGYTNAGKSTLINHLAKDDLFVENRLFATLDSYTRIVYLAHQKKVLLTDTVGFIRNLPASLIDSFRSTLEEIQHADFLLHVVDITAPDLETNLKTVDTEISNLECLDKPVVLFFNKCDLLPQQEQRDMIKARYDGAIVGSVKDRTGIEELRNKMLELYDLRYGCVKSHYTQH